MRLLIGPSKRELRRDVGHRKTWGLRRGELSKSSRNAGNATGLLVLFVRASGYRRDVLHALSKERVYCFQDAKNAIDALVSE
jgi:hypothetical protein